MEQTEVSHNLQQLINAFIELRHSNHYREFDKEFIAKKYNAVLVLSFLLEHGNAVVSHELAEALVRSTSQMAVLLNQMEAQGYIIRCDDTEDARQTIVSITPQGEEFCNESIARCKQLIGSIFEIMGEEQSEQFVSSFKVFLEACSAVHSERSIRAEDKGKETRGKG